MQKHHLVMSGYFGQSFAINREWVLFILRRFEFDYHPKHSDVP